MQTPMDQPGFERMAMDAVGKAQQAEAIMAQSAQVMQSAQQAVGQIEAVASQVVQQASQQMEQVAGQVASQIFAQRTEVDAAASGISALTEANAMQTQQISMLMQALAEAIEKLGAPRSAKVRLERDSTGRPIGGTVVPIQ